VGLADKLIGLLIELMLLIGYIRERQGANQDKSLIGLKMRSARRPTLRSTESEGVVKDAVGPAVGGIADHPGHEGRKGQKGLTQSVKREKYSIEIKDPRRILLNEKGQRR
jgi:hypothetical protein